MDAIYSTYKLNRALVFAAALLSGLALTLALLWLLGGQIAPAAAAPALDKAPSPAQEPALSLSQGEAGKPAYPLQISGWSKVKPITIYSSLVLTNYQISLVITDTDMQPDYDDVRFGDAGGNCLHYWVQTYTAASALVWVKVPSILTPTTTIYMYYGNPASPKGSDGDATFIYFDDFVNEDDWEEFKQIPAAGVYTTPANGSTTDGDETAGSYYRVQSFIDEDCNHTEGGIQSTTTVTLENTVVNWRGWQTIGTGYPDRDALWGLGDTTNCTGGSWLRRSGYFCHGLFNNAGSNYGRNKMVINGSWGSETGDLTADTWIILTETIVSSGTTAIISGTFEGADVAYHTHSSPGYTGKMQFGSDDNNDGMWIDWVLVREYASTVPTATVGSETQAADLVVAKSATPTYPNAGGPITYTITFSNAGDIDATGVVITDIVPVSVTNPGWSSSGAAITLRGGTTYVWDVVGNLAPGTGGVITITGQLSGTLPEGHVFTNLVTGTTTAAGDCPCNNSDAIPVSVNHHPVATATVNTQDIGLCSDIGELNGSSSDDVEDTPPLSGYHWTQTGVLSATLANPFTHTTRFTTSCYTEGIITFTLTVTDSGGLTGTDEITVTVKNVKVTGTWAINDSPTTLGCTTTITAGVKAGSGVTYTWDFGDGTGGVWGVGREVVTDHVYPRTCVTPLITYTVHVTASNTITSGGVSTHTEVVTTTIVTITNTAPVADAGPEQRVVVDALVTLDGSGSSDPDYPCHDIAAYYWEQTGGIVSATLNDNTAVSPTFTAPQALTMPTVLTFTLTITDAGCLTATAVTSVTVVLPVGGYTEMVNTLALLWPWTALVAVIGAAAVVTVAALKRRTAHR